MDVLIRHLDPAVHSELSRRARASDVSLRAYVSEVLTEHVAVPSVTQWLDRIDELPGLTGVSTTGADLVAAVRDEDDVTSR